jgi:hypothetical protein
MFNTELCMPAIVYLALALIGLASNIVRKKMKFSLALILAVLMNLIIVGLITYGLDYVCKRYSTRYAWYALAALMVLPILLLITFTLAIVSMSMLMR